MKKNVLNTDLTGKVAVVTGAGGVLCSYFAKVLARAGARVALLDINELAAQGYAEEIVAEGGIAKAYACNVLDKAACYGVADRVASELGPCDILINGAGGNNPVRPPIRNILNWAISTPKPNPSSIWNPKALASFLI